MKVTRRILSTRQGTLAFALLAALAAAGVLMVFISSYKRSLDASAEPVTVLVAKGALPTGSSGDMIAEKGLFQATGLKREQVKEGAITDPASLRGQVAKHEIVRGQQLTTADFGKPTDPVLSKLADDTRAVTIPLDAAHGMIGQVQPGDHVDVYAGFQVQPDGAGRPRPVLRELLQDVEVLKAPPVGDEAGKAVGGASQTESVVLRVEEMAAPQLAFASDNGKIWIVLRPQAGAGTHKPTLVNLERLLLGMDPIPVDEVFSQDRDVIRKFYREGGF
jgi:Flp pilus assembly protein CpaB